MFYASWCVIGRSMAALRNLQLGVLYVSPRMLLEGTTDSVLTRLFSALSSDRLPRLARYVSEPFRSRAAKGEARF